MKEYLYNLATDRKGGVLAAVLKIFLFLLSLIYGLAVRLLGFVSRRFAYTPDCKVISVGNITLGGTGKTSLVEYLANFLKNKGYKLAVISRGYKRKAIDYRLPAIDYDSMGDEPFMLSLKLKDVPVIVDADRKRGIGKAIREYAVGAVILDDAFQQWGIEKGLDIVAVDSLNPFGNKHMLPRGILREPLSSLRRADIFILTKANLCPDTRMLKEFLSGINKSAFVFEAWHLAEGFYEIGRPESISGPESLKGKRAALFCGIGDPGSFEKLILNSGVKIACFLKFPDHHDYSRADLEGISRAAIGNNADVIITTEKDASRLSRLRPAAGSLRLMVLRINLSIKDEQGFNSRLLDLFSL